MAFKVIDEVTADCLEIQDVIQIDDAATSETLFVVISEIVDENEVLVVKGYNIEDDEETYDLIFTPDDRVELYMEVDDD